MTADAQWGGTVVPVDSQSAIDVSVIVPVFNAEACIRSSLSSVLEQEGVNLELIVVDDGSEDATGGIVDAVAAEDPRVQVVHQENSGWAGGPRNRGFDLARGEYVLYLDADDALAEGALADLVGFARANDSDIVVPQSESKRRRLHKDVFERTLASAPLQVLARNNYTCKLFRRELLVREGIRFSDVPLRLEDAIFCFRAYAASARSSILADRVLHRLDAFDAGAHLSAQRIEPYGYAKSVDQSLAALSSGQQPSVEKDAAIADFFRRTVLTRFGAPARSRTDAENADWMRAMSPLASRWVKTHPLADHYGPLNRARLHALVEDRTQVMRGLPKKRTSSVAASAAFVACAGTSLTIDVAPILGSVALNDVKVVFSHARRAITQTVVPHTVDVRGTDEILGNPVYRLTVRIPIRDLRDVGSAAVQVHAVDQNRRPVRVRIAFSTGAVSQRRRVGGVLVTVSANSRDALQVRVQSLLRVAASGASALLRRVRPTASASRPRSTAEASSDAPSLTTTSVPDTPESAPAGTATSRAPQNRRAEGVRNPSSSAEEITGDDVFTTHRHVAVTWNIPTDFGGMTTVLFRRSRMFSRRTTRPVDVLVLAPGFVPDEWTDSLRDKGLFVEGMRLRGLWSELAAMSDADLAAIGRLHRGETDRSCVGRAITELEGEESERVDHVRDDGTLFALERRVDGKKEILLVDSRGIVATVLHRRRDLYLTWIRWVLEDDPAVVLTDSKVVAGYLHKLDRSHTALGQVFHSTHLNACAPTAFGPMNPYHLAMIQNVDSYDMTVILTERQREDFDRVMDAGDALVTIPNSLDLSKVAKLVSGRPRSHEAGAVVSRLEREKRVEDAVTAVARSRGNPRLTVYGSGGEEQNLRQLIDDLGKSDSIRLAGFASSVPSRLAEVSFLLLSSRFEGMGLVLVEAMAAGCIPIAYDIRYGPRDIITDGINGFLVPDGDIGGLTRAIEALLAMSDEDRERMRDAARARARAFDDGVIVDRWAEALAGAVRRRQLRTAGERGTTAKLTVTDVTASLDMSALRLTVHGAFAAGRHLALDVVARKRVPYIFSRRAVPAGASSSTHVGFTFETEFFAAPPGTVYDLFLRDADAGPGARLRVAAPSALVDTPQTVGDLRLYATVKGNLSVEKLER